MSNDNDWNMCCLIKGNHVYTLDHDLHVLNQKLGNTELDISVKVNKKFYIKEHNENIEYTIIDTLDDLVCIVRHTPTQDKETTIVHVILKGNDFNQFVFDRKTAG